MSAILGICRLDGRLVLPSELRQMTRSLDHRGPDGSEVWSQGSVGLGHQRMCTTPESLRESLPLATSNQGLVITADARLDNRQELMALLEVPGGRAAEIGDGELILEAYARWGEGCVEKLLGDFAFAIWDAGRRILFCARDHFGVKPFYYHLAADKAFLFASEMKALFSLPETPRRINKERIGDYLADVFSDSESTFYCDIKRLPPAHCFTVSPRGVRARRYWALDPERETRLATNNEYAEAFRELFTEAVRCRLRTAGPMGSMLSGGLDSSSITCVARNLLADTSAPLKTFSAFFDAVPECDERAFINLVLDRNGLDPHFIEGNQHAPFSNLRRIEWHADQPAYGPNCDMVWSIYESAHAQGVRILLDGHDGDTTVSYGDRYLHELARNGRWISLTSELRALARHDGSSVWESLRNFAWHYRGKSFVNKHRPLRGARRLWRGLTRRANGDREASTNTSRWEHMLNAGLADEINMADRYRAWRQTISQTAATEREAHFRMLSHPMQALALELHDGFAAAFQVEKRYPFWDKRLVEFCLSLPSQQKLNQGWTRVVMRRAMEGILPPVIQWRNDKTNFVPSLAYGIRTFERDALDEVIVRNPGPIQEYVNVNELRHARNRFIDGCAENRSADLFAIWKTVSLALWLQQTWPQEHRTPDRGALRGGGTNVNRTMEHDVLSNRLNNLRRGKLYETNKRDRREETLRVAHSHRPR